MGGAYFCECEFMGLVANRLYIYDDAESIFIFDKCPCCGKKGKHKVVDGKLECSECGRRFKTWGLK